MRSCKLFISLMASWLFLPKLLFCQQPDPSYSFTLQNNARTSAGIYNNDGILVRTLWSGVNYIAGTYELKWDGTDDSGSVVPVGNYTAKILSNQVKYQWEGVIGNTSDSATGATKYHSLDIVNSMCSSGGSMYCGAGYNEGQTSEFKFSLTSPQQRTLILPLAHSTNQSSIYTATDGSTVYWAGNDPFAGNKWFVFGTKVSDDSEVTFSNGTSLQMTHGREYLSVIDYLNSSSSSISGLAVQKEQNYLFVAHKDLNEIHVLNKHTGKLVSTIATLSLPRSLAVDADDNLWVISANNHVSKYSVRADGTLSSAILSISELVSPIALGISPDNSTIVIADGGNSQQLKAFSNITGALSWIYGVSGGYTTDPVVSNNKFYFNDFTNDIRNTFICFQPDGSFWVSDPGNFRIQHFSASRNFINRIMYLPRNYSVYADPNNSTRLFVHYLEFIIDYSKPISSDNNSWTLVKNWRGAIPLKYFNEFNILKSVTTLNNGRTYGTLFNTINHKPSVVELPQSGQARITAVEFEEYSNKQIYPDGSLRSYTVNGFNGVLTFRKQLLTGFDGSNNPVWGPPATIASTTATSDKDPVLGGPHNLSAEVTSSNIVVSFNGATPSSGGSSGYHLGGIKAGDNKWFWKTALSTHATYTGAYPADGSFDIGNYPQYSGNVAMVIERNIFWGYNGEFWKASQTNKWNHVYDNGLFVGQFGITGPEVYGQEAPAMMAGNSFSPSIVKVGNDYYLFHNDESYHAGIHRWKITGLNTIHEQSIALTGSFKRTSELPKLTGIDLMQDLPFNAVLQNSASNWTRTPVEESNAGFKEWNVRTNIKTYSRRKSPDLWIKYGSFATPSIVTRDLGNHTKLSAWKLWGKISYEDNMPNTDYTKMYFDILDSNNKILTRFYTTIQFGSPDIIKIFANNTLIASDKRSTIEPITKLLQPIDISFTSGVIKVKYAGFEPVTISTYDSTSDVRSPKIMRFYFSYSSGGNVYGKFVDIDEMRFSVTQDSSYYRSRKTGAWNAAATWQTSSDSVAWIDASEIPLLTSRSITIQDGHTVTITDSAVVNKLYVQNGSALMIIPVASLSILDEAIVARIAKLVIQSDSTGTGRIGISSGTIAGNVTVERYINSKNKGAYRLLSPTVNTAGSSKPFIRDNWQEGQNNTSVNTNSNTVPRYGIHITGSTNGANGFDATATGQPSLFTLDPSPSVQDWVPVPNTNSINLDAKTGYWVYIRGDRGVNLNDTGSTSNTTLCATGTLLTGTQTYANLQGNEGINLVTNPYACPINWNKIYHDSSTNNAANFESYYHYWNPNIGTSGGWVAVNADGVKSTNTDPGMNIQSGDAFMIKAKKGISQPVFTVKESHKTSNSATNNIRTGSSVQFMASLCYTDAGNTRIIADGVNTVFNDAYSSSVDKDDAEEIANTEENIAISRSGKALSIEGRPSIVRTDTLLLAVQNLKTRDYQWQFEPVGFNQINLQAYLDDKYLHTRVPINLSTITNIPFTVNLTPASSASDRFKVVFSPHQTLPVRFSTVRAYKKTGGIQVEWTTQQEIAIDRYEIEKSFNGQQFTKAATVPTKPTSTSPNSYNWYDVHPNQGNNYYRIKTVDQSGAVTYSIIANVKINGKGESFEVYPNPVRGNNFLIQFNNIPKGVYQVKVISVGGQTIYAKSISHEGGAANETVTINKTFHSGEYNIQIFGNGISFNKKIIK